ncbi:PQQ-dependent sugar dehydrogenase [Nitrosarchaeum koreense]|uniref:Putative Pentapeptide repeats (8 copies) n=1 Tax=Nitrosarchaeum koreense MY1 TaxID=1001994 RepID=F9CYE7_9ARCH|nr:Putative Pentapeptide repeats (8 copies) [Nitrosarchaeum koreense MY1]
MITTMTFVEDDILILQKSDGVVRLIQDGVLQDEPVLDVNVDPDGEKGMLGITSVGSTVYLYYTEANEDGGESLGNRIYKYEWTGDYLINPELLKELPSNISHNGGAMVVGLDEQVYAVIGDTLGYGLLQNKPLDWLEGDDLDLKDNGVILQLEGENPYFAMGIRNSFGLAVDPVTGNLWATENGDDNFDEINLIPEKFNSGWIVIMGPATESELASLPGYEDYIYDDPKFSWEQSVAPTGLDFAKFQEINNYDNSLFVGDCNTGNLYKFELNENRNGFEFTNSFLQDNVVNKDESLDEIIIGTGFGCVTDIERGPDGFLYVVSLSEGAIYRILPAQTITNSTVSDNGGGCLIATATYGSELAPQIQQLRELRDNSLLQTTSGTSFMSAFNQFYYSFSPTVADLERENPIFKEAVKLMLTPMISSLSILNYVDVDSEAKMLGYGISLILLNVGMYFVAPAITVWQIKKRI